METKIISEDPIWRNSLALHERAVSQIQFVVNDLTDLGLKVTIEDLKDLINNGSALSDQVSEVVAKTSLIHKLISARSRYIAENTDALLRAISDAKESLEKILKLNSMNPLSIDAFAVEKSIVGVSEAWKEELRESYIVRESEARQKAQKLIENVESAIKEINDFVKDNPNFGKGITIYSDDRRSLCYLDEAGKLVICKQELQLIN